MTDEPFEVPADWYEGFFESDWLDRIALHSDPERTRQQVGFVVAPRLPGDGPRPEPALALARTGASSRSTPGG